jgi:hypothetical protein
MQLQPATAAAPYSIQNLRRHRAGVTELLKSKKTLFVD